MSNEATHGHERENQYNDPMMPYDAIQGHIRPFIQSHIRPHKANTVIKYQNVPQKTLGTFFVP